MLGAAAPCRQPDPPPRPPPKEKEKRAMGEVCEDALAALLTDLPSCTGLLAYLTSLGNSRCSMLRALSSLMRAWPDVPWPSEGPPEAPGQNVVREGSCGDHG